MSDLDEVLKEFKESGIEWTGDGGTSFRKVNTAEPIIELLTKEIKEVKQRIKMQDKNIQNLQRILESMEDY